MAATNPKGAEKTEEVSEIKFTKVEDLRPGTCGHTLTVKVVSSKMVLQNGRPLRLAECVVGDETAVILFTARGNQVDLMRAGVTVILRNAKVELFKGCMRLAVDKSGRVEVVSGGDVIEIVPNQHNNLSPSNLKSSLSINSHPTVSKISFYERN